MRLMVWALLVGSLPMSFVPHTFCGDGTTLAVTAFDSQQHGVSGVRLSCWTKQGAAWSRHSEAVTNQDGQAELAAPPPPYTLLAACAGWVAHRVEITELRESVRLSMEPGRQLTVDAIAVGSTTPILRFRVLPLSEEALESTSSTQAFALESVDAVESDAETGSAIVGGIDRRTRLLLVLAPGNAPAFVPVPDGATARVRAPLDASGCKEYRVVDRSGAPVTGARAALAADLLGSWESRLALVPQSSESGYLTLCRSAANSAPAIVAHPNFAARLWSWDSNDSDIVLADGGSLIGEALDADRLPLRGSTITVSALGLEHSSRVADDGRFELLHLPAGEWQAQLSDTRLPSGRRTRVQIANDRVTHLDFGPPALQTVRVFQNEQPLEQGKVLLLAGKTASELVVIADADVVHGQASLPVRNFEPPVRLALRRGDAVVFGKLDIRQTSQERDPEMQLKLLGTTVRGLVIAAATHKPLLGAQLTCQRGANSFLSMQRGPLWLEALAAAPLFDGEASVAVTGKTGRFELFLPDWCTSLQVAGPRALAVEDRAWQPHSIATNTIDRSAELSIELVPAATLRARVVVEPGVPAHSVTLSMRRSGERSNALSRSVVLNETVRVELPDRGPWWLAATASGVAPAVVGPISVESESDSAASEPLELQLEAGAFLDLPSSAAPRVLDRAGTDWREWVSAQELDNSVRRLGPFPLGTYRVIDGERSKTINLREAGQVLRVFMD